VKGAGKGADKKQAKSGKKSVGKGKKIGAKKNAIGKQKQSKMAGKRLANSKATKNGKGGKQVGEKANKKARKASKSGKQKTKSGKQKTKGGKQKTKSSKQKKKDGSKKAAKKSRGKSAKTNKKKSAKSKGKKQGGEKAGSRHTDRKLNAGGNAVRQTNGTATGSCTLDIVVNATRKFTLYLTNLKQNERIRNFASIAASKAAKAKTVFQVAAANMVDATSSGTVCAGTRPPNATVLAIYNGLQNCSASAVKACTIGLTAEQNSSLTTCADALSAYIKKFQVPRKKN
jgi:hypothetical protein